MPRRNSRLKATESELLQETEWCDRKIGVEFAIKGLNARRTEQKNRRFVVGNCSFFVRRAEWSRPSFGDLR